MQRTMMMVLALIMLSSMIGSAADTNIRLNSLGFLPDKGKRASINTACSQFTVIRVPAGTTASSGSVSGPRRNTDTDEDIYTADFSALTEEGTFYLNVEGVGRSPDFPIKKDVYNFAYYTAVRAMYLWRCGCAVSGVFNGSTYKHAACHMSDAYLDYVGGGHLISPSLKGWHDAGDFNKYTVNAGITVGMMLDAWELFGPLIENIPLDIPETGGKFPDFLAEVKWELDWLLTMQNSDGSVSHKVSALNFCAFIMPEAETADRFFVPWGSAATADFVAMTAMAARIYKPYDSLYSRQCLNAAIKSYNFLAANPADHQPNQSAFSTGGYGTTDPDDRLWAAAEMWETAGEQKYLMDFETRANSQSVKVDIDWDWGNVKNLGMFTYLLSKRAGKNAGLYDAIKTGLIQVADGIVATRNNHGYGRTLGATYYWGCNGTVARQTMVLQIANLLSPNKDYVNTALDAIGHLFGRNYYCRSFVTGLGINPPMNPHDRRSGADNIRDPWPGYLVGGSWPGAKSWVDVQDNYEVNEICINWQSPLIFALAGFVNPPASGIRPFCQGNRSSGLQKRDFYRTVNGCARASIPIGHFCFYDCKGRYLMGIDAPSPRVIDLSRIGLRQGIYFVKAHTP